MKLVVGLGNPGEKYRYTRHNVGFIVVEEVVGGKDWKERKILLSTIYYLPSTILAKPLTSMNNSGEAVKKLVDYCKINLDNLLVIHDELDLPLGEYKLQKGRNSAGHKGVESVISALGSKDFWRLRVGIGKSEKVKDEDYVLREFSKEELNILLNLTKNKLIPEIKTWTSSRG